MENQKQINFFIIILLLFISPLPGFGAKINKSIGEIASLMSELYPRGFVQSRGIPPKELVEIQRKVTALRIKFESNEEHIKRGKLGQSLQFEVMRSYLREMEQNYRQGHIQYADSMLRGMGELCLQCHVYDNKKRTLFRGLKRHRFSSTLDFAIFSLMTRDYPKAKRQFLKFLKNSAESKNQDQEKMALNGVVITSVKMGNTPGTLIRLLDQVEPYVSESVKIRLAEWRASTEKEVLYTLNGLGFEQFKKRYLISFEENPPVFVDSKNIVKNTFLTLQLQNYLVNSKIKKKEIGESLYYLALIDRSQRFNFFYSLSDLYLKQCMKGGYSRSIGKKCYKLFKDYMEFSFTGSSGTDLPDDVKREILRYQKIVQ